MTASGGAVFVADGEHRVAVFYAPTGTGRRRRRVPAAARLAGSRGRGRGEGGTDGDAEGGVRARGAENPRAFDEMLAEERGRRRRRRRGGGLAGFAAEVERRARAFMRESDA